MNPRADTSHRAVAAVDLGAIAANVRAVRARLRTGVFLCAVVKANAYGHGALPVGREALRAGADLLAVATVAEAELLREGGVGASILILGPLTPEELERANGCSAEVVVWSDAFARHVARTGGRVHVKLDTGMGRIGLRDPAAATRLVRFLANSGGVDLVGAMTHLATADQPGSSFAREQLARFKDWTDPLKEEEPGLLLHAANSAATLALPASRLDMVRVGIAIYGLDPFQNDPEDWGLAPALRLTSYVADIKACEPGDSVGYGQAFVARRSTRIATVPIGYADGVRRSLGGRGVVAIADQRHPIIGRVSMDMLAVDIGAAEVGLGDTVELIGPSVSVEEMAGRLDTINYEITCGLSQRVVRRYLETTSRR
ncbi:MAG: alanine racemase [Actinobacteria bacterium]|nr:alanine racemase [Actinomycetota bacterium]